MEHPDGLSMSHDQLQEDLASHLRGGTDRMVWTNTQLGPSGSPRPDVFTVNKSFSRFRSDCYEIKVSVSDLRHDVTSGKWQSYRKFGHAVWFAFPRGLVPLELVPKECGIILRGETWRAARKPVAQVLDTLPRDTWLKLLMEGAPRFMAGPCTPRSSDEWRAAELSRKRWGKAIGDMLRDRCRAEGSYEYATKQLEESAAKITAEVATRRQRALDQAKADMANLDEAMKELAAVLCLKPEEQSIPDLTSAIRRFQRNLRGRGLTDAITLLTQLSAAITTPEVSHEIHGI